MLLNMEKLKAPYYFVKSIFCFNIGKGVGGVDSAWKFFQATIDLFNNPDDISSIFIRSLEEAVE